MTGPFNVLCIGADADERTIKVAYAKLLKLTRPDEDPSGFQRLNEAYQHALAIVGARTASVTECRDSQASEPPDTAHQPPERGETGSQRPAFRPQAFLAEYRQISEAGDAGALSRWLMDYPAFWHLPIKREAGQFLLNALSNAPQAISPDCFNVTAAFFHYDDALSNFDAINLRRVANRVRAAWLVAPENRATLAHQVSGISNWRTRWRIGRTLKRLARPFSWWRDLPWALRPAHARNAAKIAFALSPGDPGGFPLPINCKHAAFWMDVCGPEKSRTRRLLALFRSLVALLLLPAVLATVIGAVQYLLQAPDWRNSAALAWKITTFTVAFIVMLYWLLVGLGIAREPLLIYLRRHPLLMASVVPMTCVLALLVNITISVRLGTSWAIVIMFVVISHLASRYQNHERNLVEWLAVILMAWLFLAGIVRMVEADALPGYWRLFPTVAIVTNILLMWGWDGFRRSNLRSNTMT